MKPPNAFDDDDWVEVAQIAVATGAVLWIAMTTVVLFARAPIQCPGWHLRHGESLWGLLFLWGLPFNAFACLTALNRDQVILQATKSDYFTGMSPTYFFVCLCVIESAVAQFPLFLLLTNCL
jgi:hypothetical protein